MKPSFVIERATAADAAAQLAYLKAVGGETENLSFGPEGVPLTVEQEAEYLGAQETSPDNVQFLAKADGEIIGTASLNRKPRKMSHRGEFGISVRKAFWGCGAAQTQKREPVLALQCTHPTSLSTIRPAGDGAVDGLPVAESLQDVRRYADVLEETYGVRILLSSQCRVAERPLGAVVMT